MFLKSHLSKLAFIDSLLPNIHMTSMIFSAGGLSDTIHNLNVNLLFRILLTSTSSLPRYSKQTWLPTTCARSATNGALQGASSPVLGIVCLGATVRILSSIVWHVPPSSSPSMGILAGTTLHSPGTRLLRWMFSAPLRFVPGTSFYTITSATWATMPVPMGWTFATGSWSGSSKPLRISVMRRGSSFAMAAVHQCKDSLVGQWSEYHSVEK